MNIDHLMNQEVQIQSLYQLITATWSTDQEVKKNTTQNRKKKKKTTGSTVTVRERSSLLTKTRQTEKKEEGRSEFLWRGGLPRRSFTSIFFEKF